MALEASQAGGRAALIAQAIQAQEQFLAGLHEIGPWLELDLTMGQLKALIFLARRGPTTISAMAGAMRLSRPSASTLVEQLVQLGLVERVRDVDDRRRAFAGLTGAGRDRLGRLREVNRERLRQWLERLEDGDLAALAQGLTALAALVSPDTAHAPAP